MVEALHSVTAARRVAPPCPPLKFHEHAAWKRLITERCGLLFGPTRRHFLARRLWQRMTLGGHDSYLGYLDQVVRDDAEWLALVELLLNGETSFFRHPASYDALQKVLHDMLRRNPQKARLQLWSAGCSTGQETYSMAICALDALIAAGRRTDDGVSVTGSDLRPSALAAARHGRYRRRQLQSLPAPARRRYFRGVGSSGDGTDPDVVEVEDALRRVTRWRPWNITEPATYPVTPHDVVFCHNVLIYLAREERDVIVQRLAACLRPGGYLFLAPGEMPWPRQSGLTPVRFPDCLIYRRTP